MEDLTESDSRERILCQDFSEEVWTDINSTLAEKFRDFHLLLGTSTGSDIGKLGDAIADIVYDEVLRRSATQPAPVNREPKPKINKLLQSAKQQVSQARQQLKADVNKQQARYQLNLALRSYQEVARKVNKTETAHRQRKHEKRFRRNAFAYIKQEFEFSSSKVQPDADTRDQITDTLRTIYSAPEGDLDTSWWIPYPEPQFYMNDLPVLPRDVRRIVYKMRSFSAPGPDGIQPVMMKKLPAYQHVLATLFSRIIQSGEVPPSWHKGRVIFIHKKGDRNNISNYRPITLTSVVSKAFNSILNRRLCDFLNDNGYIDRTTQKGFQKGIQGCTEHTLVLKRVIDVAKKRKHAAHVVWLDIANAFGSVPHEVMIRTLQHLHVPEWLVTYVRNFYHDISVVGQTLHYNTHPISIKRGVFQGDTLSPTIFIAVFNHCIRYLATEKKHGLPLKDEQVLSLAFADDLTVLCKDARSMQRILNSLRLKLEKLNLFLKPSKCSSLSLKGGSFDESRIFKLGDTNIETIRDSPAKFLGMEVYSKNQQSNAGKHVTEKLETLLAKVDALPLRGQYKCDIYDRYVTACLRFDLTVYDVAPSVLEMLDRSVRNHLRKWIRMPPSTHLAIASHSKGLNIEFPSHLYESGHAALLMEKARDDPVLDQAIAHCFEHNSAKRDSIMTLSHGAQNKLDLKQHAKQARDLKSEQLASECQKQGGWHSALESMDSDLTWRSCLIGLSESTYSFALRCLTDSLPTNNNLCLWGKVTSPKCHLCGSDKETLHHILNHCSRALER